MESACVKRGDTSSPRILLGSFNGTLVVLRDDPNLATTRLAHEINATSALFPPSSRTKTHGFLLMR